MALGYVMLLAVVLALAAAAVSVGFTEAFYVLLLVVLILGIWFKRDLGRLFILLVAWPFRAWKRSQRGEP